LEIEKATKIRSLSSPKKERICWPGLMIGIGGKREETTSSAK
jgi:hypothetical protein